jgi:hypothetical protein
LIDAKLRQDSAGPHYARCLEDSTHALHRDIFVSIVNCGRRAFSPGNAIRVSGLGSDR